ncbi:MAG: hypothetical protein CL670_12565 [Balneola sp.]|jgi:hypothetical protein|nr:hypothetical protein [Balneola sp.]MBE79980.1 hypothetical protein [Balneola sp.]|tara:strand:- start:1233 stop:1652 length:420 start_codon:yes stop_codon:yes gene_type:complete
MNIIQVCPYDLSIPGGVQTHVTQLSNELVRKNHKVIVFAPSLTKSSLERKFDCKIEHITGSVRIPWWGRNSLIDHSIKDCTHITATRISNIDLLQVGTISYIYQKLKDHNDTIFDIRRGYQIAKDLQSISGLETKSSTN